MAEQEKNQGAAVAWPNSRPQLDCDAVVGAVHKQMPKPQWTEVTLQRRASQISSTEIYETDQVAQKMIIGRRGSISY